MAAGRNKNSDKIVLDRDNYKCQYCGTTSDIHIHHIRYKSHFGKSQLETQESPRNKVVLCATCHDLTHRGILVVIYSVSDPERPIVVTLDNWKSKLDFNIYFEA